MSGQPPFRQGQNIVLREMWKGKIWSARPAIVIQDKPELMAFYIPVETICITHRAPGDSPAAVDNIVRSDWVLQSPEPEAYHRLKVIIPGKKYSVILFRNPADGSRKMWYINLEEPVGRTELSYDYTDLLLDVIVSPDLSEWRWEDEDELEEAVATGLISKEKAGMLYKEGKRCVDWLQSGKSPFNGWEKWQAGSSWEIPILPEGWDKV